MSEHVDLGPSADRFARIAQSVADDQLEDPTPDAGRSVGQLIQHIVGLSRAFRAAGTFERALSRCGRDPNWSPNAR